MFLGVGASRIDCVCQDSVLCVLGLIYSTGFEYVMACQHCKSVFTGLDVSAILILRYLAHQLQQWTIKQPSDVDVMHHGIVVCLGGQAGTPLVELSIVSYENLLCQLRAQCYLGEFQALPHTVCLHNNYWLHCEEKTVTLVHLCGFDNNAI